MHFYLFMQLADDPSLIELYILAFGFLLNVTVISVSWCNCIALHDSWLEICIRIEI